MTEAKAVRWEKGSDGIVVVTLDDPGRSANTMNERFGAAFDECVNALVADKEDITGVILTSAKKTFFAGGDLDSLSKATPADAPRFFEQSMAIKTVLRRLETLGRPVVAAMNGTALGGGLEIGLACHHRIGLDAKGVLYGLPEVTLGLLPGAPQPLGRASSFHVADLPAHVLGHLLQHALLHFRLPRARGRLSRLQLASRPSAAESRCNHVPRHNGAGRRRGGATGKRGDGDAEPAGHRTGCA